MDLSRWLKTHLAGAKLLQRRRYKYLSTARLLFRSWARENSGPLVLGAVLLGEVKGQGQLQISSKQAGRNTSCHSEAAKKQDPVYCRMTRMEGLPLNSFLLSDSLPFYQQNATKKERTIFITLHLSCHCIWFFTLPPTYPPCCCATCVTAEFAQQS